MKLTRIAVIVIGGLSLATSAFAGGKGGGSPHNIDKRLAHAHWKDEQFDEKAGKGEGSKQEEHWDRKVHELELLQELLEGNGE